ncbi:hypothetical protein ONZ45_g4948 [Pleurotus djamor]|nr:hypothetical protein ONZ45_g4948 [Pleurotus djamor]
MASAQETCTESSIYPVEQASGCGSLLRPITSTTTDRYYKNAQVPLSHRSVAPGLGRFGQEEMPTYLPEHWSTHVQPEGQLYFCRNTKPVVITEAYLYNPENLQRLTEWLQVIQRLLDEKRIFVHDNVELFIQLEDAGCAYYFIDHHARTEFWLDAVDTETLGLPQVASEGHLKLALTEHYWAHVEFFPSHFPGLPTSVFDELTSVLAHAKLDRLTSNLSTFPYSSDECSNYIKLLKATRGNVDPTTTCMVARLWMLISSHRFTTHYGQESARLSRTQPILALPTYTDNDTKSKIMQYTSLGLSEIYKNKFEEIFIDDVVYIDEWNKFIKSSMKDWKLAAQIADYLLAIRSETHGFQLPGYIFALPMVLTIFGGAAFVTHGLALLALHIHLGLAVGFSLFTILFTLAIRRALSPRASPRDTPSSDSPEKCEV